MSKYMIAAFFAISTVGCTDWTEPAGGGRQPGTNGPGGTYAPNPGGNGGGGGNTNPGVPDEQLSWDGLVIEAEGPSDDVVMSVLEGEIFYQNRGWRELKSENGRKIRWQDEFFPEGGDARFIVWWVFEDGTMTWSCINGGIVQGRVSAWFWQNPLPVTTDDAPSSDGCEMWIR